MFLRPRLVAGHKNMGDEVLAQNSIDGGNAIAIISNEHQRS